MPVFSRSHHHGGLVVLCFSILLHLGTLAHGQQPDSPLVSSFAAYQHQRQSTPFGILWKSVGPLVNSARVEAVQLDPTKPGTMYAAFGSGGLWKTTDNGLSWNSIFDDQASYGIGDIALAPSDPNVIYVGTGESLKKPRNFTMPGTGVYRSDDAGATWQHLGLNDSWHISEIAVHPSNPDIVLVAVLGHFWSANQHRGLYRTADGGKTWQQVLYVNERTGGNDVVWTTDNPTVVYASMWQHAPEVSGPGSGVYRSVDAGITWERCKEGLPGLSGDHPGVGRIGLAVSQTNASKVYALIDNRELIDDEAAAQVYRSIDGGKTWAMTHEAKLPFFSRIGWYFADLYVNPLNDEEIYALGVRLAHSTDGGKTFDVVKGEVSHVTPSEASGLHLDHCELWINPANPEHIVLGNDGGLYQSWNKGNTWLHHNNIPTGEFYDVAVDNRANYKIYAGAQDDSTVYGSPADLGPTRTNRWKYLWIDAWNGGDGCVTQIDPEDPDTVYFSAQEGAFRRKNMRTNRSKAIRAKLPKNHDGAPLQFSFVAPLTISPHDSKTLFLAGNYAFRSVDRGDNWELISPNFAGEGHTKRESFAAGSIAESPLQRETIYVGMDKGEFWATTDGGATWKDRSGELPTAYVRCISPSSHNDSRLYIAMSGMNYDDLQTYFFRSDDHGENWINIASNLSKEPANVIIEDPVRENVLYAGTFRGAYISLDFGENWSLLGRNLPACSVADMTVQQTANDLVIATHGRGIYRLNLDCIHEFVAKQLGETKEDSDLPRNYLFPVPTLVRPYLSDTRPTMNFRAPQQTTISYYSSTERNVEVSVAHQDGQVIHTFAHDCKSGINQIEWDGTIKENSSLQPYYVNYKEFIPPGSYNLTIKSNIGSHTQPLVVADTQKMDE